MQLIKKASLYFSKDLQQTKSYFGRLSIIYNDEGMFDRYINSHSQVFLIMDHVMLGTRTL